MITTPLEFIKERALAYKALAVALVAYEPRLDVGEAEKYEGQATPIFVPLGQVDVTFDRMREDAAHNDQEVAICSEFISYIGKPCHFVFGDVETGKACPTRTGSRAEVVPVRSSLGPMGVSDRWHFYTRETEGDFSKLQSRLLLVPGIDVKWVSAGLFNGFNILRLTAHNATRFPHSPHLLNPIEGATP